MGTTDMVSAMAMVTVWDTTAMDMAMVWATMARGLLMPSLWPRLMLIPTTMVDTTDMVSAMAMVVWDTTAMDMDMVWDTMAMVWATMARGLLMPSLRPRLMLIPTTMVDTMDMVSAMAMVTVWDTMVMDMAMATTDKPSQKYLLHTKHHQGNLDIQDL